MFKSISFDYFFRFPLKPTNYRIFIEFSVSKVIKDKVSFKGHFFPQNFKDMFFLKKCFHAHPTQSFCKFDSLNENLCERFLRFKDNSFVRMIYFQTNDFISQNCKNSSEVLQFKKIFKKQITKNTTDCTNI